MADEMKDLRTAVAKKLGWDQCSDGDWIDPRAVRFATRTVYPPEYLHSMDAAFQLVCFMGINNKVSLSYEVYIKPRCRCTVFADGGGGTYKKLADIEAETMPEAICKAFLLVPLATPLTVLNKPVG